MATRRLKQGDVIPSGTPKRYITSGGYVLLRWKIGPKQYVEVTEHRLTAGLSHEHVHHRNGNKSDNRLSNLLPMSASKHAEEHRREARHWDEEEACRLYKQGLSTPQIGARLGVDASVVYRGLRPHGIPTRNISASKRIAVDEKELIGLYEQGLRPERIAAELGITGTVVRSRMKELGLPAYPSGRPAHPERSRREGWIRASGVKR